MYTGGDLFCIYVIIMKLKVGKFSGKYGIRTRVQGFRDLCFNP